MEDDLCPFCKRIDEGEFVLDTPLAVAFPDAYPISPGHTLIVPRRHEPDFFQLTPEEQAQMLALTSQVRTRLASELDFEGVNIGVNSGEAAGQTVDHAHLHFIPRYHGDVAEPAGGVRWLFPDKTRYWAR